MQLTRMAGLLYTLLHFMEDLDVFSCFCVGVDMQVMLRTQAAVQVRCMS